MYSPMEEKVEFVEEYLFKIVLIGDPAVGKSNLLSRYSRDEFNVNSKPTIGVEFHTQSTMVDGKKVTTQIWDTAGQERFRTVTSAYYRGAVGALIVYDITRRQSFQNIGHWLEELRMHGNACVVVMMVGNKCDLENERKVQVEEAQAFAEEEKLFFIETSALNATNACEAFQCCIEEILNTLSRRVLSHHDPSNAMENINLKDKVTILQGNGNQRINFLCCSI